MTVNIKNISLDYYKRQFFGDYLNIEGLTEIAVNRPGEIWCQVDGIWYSHDIDITYEHCYRFAATLANYNADTISDIKPLLSATLESGERVQIVLPPACERETISITLRKPSTRQIPHEAYKKRGFYDQVEGKEKCPHHDERLTALFNEKRIADFIEMAVKLGKTIIFAGATGSGKTTYMKTLIEYIPAHLRLLTIEDNPEVKFFKHKNYVHLFYPSESGNDGNAIVTPASLLKSTFRMKPDRILLTEVRGGETWDFYKVVSSGHGGSMTSLHAGSADEAIEGLIERCYQNRECQNLTYDVLLRKILGSTDIICCVSAEGVTRRMGEIYYRPLHREHYLRRLN